MQFLPVLISTVIALTTFIPVASASVISREMPLTPSRYDIAADPLMLIWTFGTEPDKVVVTVKGELTGDEKKLARWKEKQANLWDKLETGKRFSINTSAYTAAADECGKNDGITASGLKVAAGRTLACPASYPFGARILIDGVGEFRCEDRGGAIRGNKFDIYMETKSEAFAFGRQHLEATIID
jgi:3D (Asp-Asp-Asp) domain-containing protein